MSLNMAHKSVIILLLFTTTYLLLFHHKPFCAGAVFGLVAFKPHLAIVVWFAMLLKRQWSFVVGSGMTFLALGVVSVAISFQSSLDFLEVCLQATDYQTVAGYRLADAHGVLSSSRLFAETYFSTGIRSPVMWSICSVIVAAVLYLAARIMRGQIEFGSPRFSLQYSALVLLTVLLSPHFYGYDLTILLIPLGLTAFAFSSSNASSPGSFASCGDRATGFDALMALEGVVAGRWLVACGVAIYVGAGLFASVAQSTGLQPSLLLLTALLWQIRRLTTVGLSFQ
jgi:hypothetical protein